MGAAVGMCGRSRSAWSRTSADACEARITQLGQWTKLLAGWRRFAEMSLLRPRLGYQGAQGGPAPHCDVSLEDDAAGA